MSITKFNPTHQDFYPLIRTNKPQNIRGRSVYILTDKLPTSPQVHLHFRTNWQLQYQLKTEFYNKLELRLSTKQLDNTSLQYTNTQLQCHFTTISHCYFSTTSLQFTNTVLHAIVFTDSPTQWHTTVNRHLHSVCSSQERIGTRPDNGWSYTNSPQDQSASVPLNRTSTGCLVSALR